MATESKGPVRSNKKAMKATEESEDNSSSSRFRAATNLGPVARTKSQRREMVRQKGGKLTNAKALARLKKIVGLIERANKEMEAFKPEIASRDLDMHALQVETTGRSHESAGNLLVSIFEALAEEDRR